MRPVVALSFSVVAVFIASLAACSGGNSSPGFGNSSSSGGSGGGSGSSGGSGGDNGSSGGSSGLSSSGDDGGSGDGSGGGVTTKTTVYANSDHNLFSVDPMTKAVTLIGPFSDTTDVFTDVAVNGNGDVYVNTESAVFKCTLPSGGTGTVQVAQVASIAGAGTTEKFYALAFAPAGALDPNNEVLIGGDGSGVLWSIDTSSGATKQLGSFGTVNNNGTMATLGLSGDMVFYTDANNNPVGLATIRASSSGTDWLAGIDMAAMKTAYFSGTPAGTLLKGVYGGSGTSLGNGTGYHDVFGLGAWSSTVFGFTRTTKTGGAAQVITIDTTTGAGMAVPSSVTFPAGDTGWSGAGVTTKVTVTVPQPPPPPQ